MSTLRTAPFGRHGRWAGLRAAREVLGAAARRLFLDRQAEFWLGELDPARSLTERRATVTAVVDETPDVKTFALAPGFAWPVHRAGQYVPVDVEVDGVRTRRCYSISSAPGDLRPTITVKKVPGGRVSAWMHQRVTVGSVLTLGDPAGEFVLPEPTPEKIVFVSGGSGVTPVMAMLRELAARDAVRDVVFVHCARSKADVIFGRELTALGERHPGLRLALRCDDDPTSAPLDAARLRAIVPDLAEREAFLCGPAPMMSAVEGAWVDAGVTGRLHRERFGAERPSSTADPARVVTLTLARSKRAVVTEGAGTLLEHLERAGERPAYGCRMGICQTCRCRKRSGTVEDAVTGAVSSEPDEDIRLCVSVARSDVDLAL